MIAPNMNDVVGTYDVVFITLDTLRFDVAQSCFESGELPHFSQYLPESGWERRHTPGSFTYAAHQAFFAGFLPTPAAPGKHRRLFASTFRGSETTGESTFCFSEANLVQGLEASGYRTICAGGVGFFNKQTELGSVFPNLFSVSEWNPSFGVTDIDSFQNQISWVGDTLTDALSFVFINVSALHQPNYFYVQEERVDDTIESHAAALRYVDSQFDKLTALFEKRTRPAFFIVCSDHGTAYGEDGFSGHRLAHRTVWDVPYAQFFLD